MNLFRGKSGGLIAFLSISALVLGGLAWATHEALRLEDEQRRLAGETRITEARKQSQERLRVAHEQSVERLRQAKQERIDQIRLALWRLDSRLAPPLAREDSRPFPHYVPIHSPFPALTHSGTPWAPGQVFLPSPLLTAELPEWITLHFQIDAQNGWMSPQVIPETLEKTLRKQPVELALHNCTPERLTLLDTLKTKYPPKAILKTIHDRGLAWNESEKKLLSVIELSTQNNENNRLNTNPMNNVTNGYNYAVPQQAQQVLPSQEKEGKEQKDLQNSKYNPASNTSIPPELQEFYRRSINSSRGKSEGQWAFLNDGRNFAWSIPSYPQKTMVLTEQPVEVELGSMKPIWLPNAQKPEHLVMVRAVQVGTRLVYRGFLCDWQRLQNLLKNEIEDQFPEAKFITLAEGDPPCPDRTMTALPVELDPQMPSLENPELLPSPVEEIELTESPSPTWTPLRFGLGFAWVAALIALIAVGLGGWSLIDLSERRIRFVSAVTHELRTPLTTLRLYLDLLSSGLVTDEKQKEEYLKTLNGESERLNRLIGNVLDFARLEKSRPTVEKRPVILRQLFDQLFSTWQERCAAAGKELIVDFRLPEDASISTDANLLEQILCNLIDNAQKYSREAADPRIWLRARREGSQTILEVEDRGPGIQRKETSSIFRAFRRGRHADVTAGGAGLGLALGTRWASFIHGRLSVHPGEGNVGACFRLELGE